MQHYSVQLKNSQATGEQAYAYSLCSNNNHFKSH